MATVQAGGDTIAALSARLPLAGVIGLGPRQPGDAISGYMDLQPVADALGLPFIAVERYDLQGCESQFASLEMDVLLVCGWQRLLPDWLIALARLGTVGIHGSACGITGGRGRSPLNWALILGMTSFSLSLFRIESGVDSGPILATRILPLEPWDDIASAYHKTSMATVDMMVDAVRNGRLRDDLAQEQSEAEARYLPQRLPEDGGIDWTRSAVQVHGFVRALGRPYPGARTGVDGQGFVVWRGRPFDDGVMRSEAKPGTILATFHDGTFLVHTGNGGYLIEEISPPLPLRLGQVLTSEDFQQQMRRIVQRHRSRYPLLPVAPDILTAAGLA